MKIGYDLTQAQYQGTGVGNYTRYLLESLVKLETGDQHWVVAGSWGNYQDLQKLARPVDSKLILKLPSKLYSQVLAQLKIDWLKSDLDIFHASDWVLPKLGAIPLVTTIHDLTALKFPEHHHPNTVKFHQRRYQIIRRSGITVIADSQATKQDCLDLLKLKSEQVYVVPLAADPSYNQFADLSHKQQAEQIQGCHNKYQLQNPYLISVGTVEPRKNLKRLVKAFSIYARKQVDIDLVIIGRVGWGQGLPQVSEELRHRIKLLGYVDQQYMPALVAGAKAMVYPSLYEGFGLPVLEAMTVGTPVLTSKISSLPEVGGQAAVYVEPESIDSLVAGLTQVVNQAAGLVNQSKLQAKKFSWELTAEKTRKVYETAL